VRAPRDERRWRVTFGMGGIDLLAHASRLEPHMTILKPVGSGPFPVVVQMHGCGGISPLQARYAEAARRAGVAVIVLDSLAPRGISRLEAQVTVCSGARLRGAERAVDFLAMLGWLEAQDWIDPTRIGAAGWSHGGWSIMEALAGVPPEAAAMAPRLARLKTVVLFYPYAGPLSRTRSRGWGQNRPAIHACLGGCDAVVGTIAPARALRRLADDGLDVRILNLSEATHCFDDDQASDPRTHYRADLSEQAAAFYVQALSETLVS
jgi:dienelactone hydrolase